MMYKIYFNDKPLFLVSEITKEIQEYLHHDDTVLIDELNSHSVKAMIHEMENEKIRAGVFLFKDIDATLQAFIKKLYYIQAAGGLVHTDKNELLMIFRKGKWDLPKGKLEKNEDLQACAVREIIEETGLVKVNPEKPLHISYHTYHQDGKHILKESHWFLMNSEKQKEFMPQVEEDIEKCEWVSIDKIQTYLENAHASIVDVINAGIKNLIN